MSRTIDDKVVSMQFDNAQFESGVKDSMDTLAKLKQALDMSVVGKSIDAVQVKFSALDAFVKRTLENMADNAYNAGKKMLKSLTIDNIGAGWQKYADKTAAVQTIMSATAQTWEDSANQMARAQDMMERGIDEKVANSIAARYSKIADGTMTVAEAAKELGMTQVDFEAAASGLDAVAYSGSQMEYVDQQLARLNWFTDETSYKFLDMVNNIGKFTSNNIPLEQSVTAMQGIATWAGISGANTNEAGRAMYNLSQAMSVGAVKLMDWKSIENANMATAEFKQTAIDTAVAMGTLTKNADGTFKTLKGNEVSVKNFNAALSDAWFTSEVLMTTLDKYGGFSVKLQEVSEQTELTAAEILGFMDDYREGELDMERALESIHESMGDTSMTADELKNILDQLTDSEYELGERAFRAAQQAKTFQDVIDYIKEAVSTGWSNTFQNIFGNYEEARDFWSQMAEELYGVFVEAGDERNALLSAWKDAGGRDDLVEAFWNIFHAVTGIINAIKSAFRDIFPKTTVDNLTNLTAKLRDFSRLLAITDEETGELNARGEKIRSTFRGIFAVFSLVKDVVVAILKPIGNLFTGMGSGLLNTTASIGDLLTNFRETVKESGVLEEITKRVGGVFSSLNTFIGDTIQLFKGVSFWEGGGGISGVFESIFDGLNNVINLFFNLISAITGKDLTSIRDKVVTTIQSLRNKIVDGLEPLNGVFERVKSALGKGYQYIKDVFSNFKSIDVSGLFKLHDDSEKALSPINKLFEGLKNVFSAVWEVLKKVSPLISKVISGIGELLGKVGKSVADAVKNADFTNLLDFANSGALVAIGIGIKKFFDQMKGLSGEKGIGGVFSSIKDLLGGLKEAMNAWTQDKKADVLLKIAGAIAILAISLTMLAGIDPGALTQSIAAVTGLFVELMGSLKFMSTFDKGSMKNISGAGKIMIELAAAVLILAIALKKIASLNSDDLAKGLVGVTVLLAEMVVVMKVLSSEDNKKMMSGAMNAIMFAGAIYVLVGAVKSLSSLGLEQLAVGIGGITVLIAELVIAAKLLSGDSVSTSSRVKGSSGTVSTSSSSSPNAMMKGAVNAVIFAAALRVLVTSVKALASMSLEELAKGLGGLGILIAEIVIAAKVLSSGNGEKMLKGAVNAIIFAAALRVLVTCVKALGDIDTNTLIKGLGSLAVLLAEIVIAAKLMTGTASGTGSMLLAAAALLVLSGALKVIASIPWDALIKGLVAVGVSLALLVAAAWALSPVAGVLLAVGAAMLMISAAAIGFGVALMAIGAGLGMFAVSAEVGMKALVGSIDILLTAIPDIIASLASSLAESVDSTAQLIISIGQALIQAIRDLIPDGVETVLEVISTVLDSVAQNIQPIVESLLDIVVGIIRGLAEKVPVILKEIVNMIKGIFDVLVDAMGDMNVADVTNAIAFMGAMDILMVEVAAFAVGALAATAVLPTIGRNISSFVNSLMPFFNTISGIDPGVIAASESVANMILAFTEAGAIDGLAGWIPGSAKLEDFGQELVAFAPYFVEYSDKVSGVKSDTVKASSIAAQSIVAFADNIPKRGGLVALITGENSLADFAEELRAFTDPFVYYAKAIEIVKPSVVANSSAAIESIIAFADNIPKRGGLVALITGENSLSDFAEELQAFSDPFANYAKKVEDIKPSAVTASARAAESISSFVSAIPKTGGLVQLVTGQNDLGKFAKGLEAFTDPFVAFAKGVGGLGKDQVLAATAASTAATTMAEFAKIVPPSGGIVQLVTGQNSLAAFGAELAAFGPNLKAYVDSIGNTTFDKVEESGKSALVMADVFSKLPTSGGVKAWLEGGRSLSDFGAQLRTFGPDLRRYSDAIAGIESGQIATSARALTLIAFAASTLPTDSGLINIWAKQTTLSQFGRQLKSFGPSFAEYADSVSGITEDTITVSSNALKIIAEAAKTLPNDTGVVNIWAKQTTLSKFGEQLKSFAPDFVTYSNNIKELSIDDMARASAAIRTLVDITNSLSASGGIAQWFTGSYDIEDFGESLAAFGSDFAEYSKALMGVDIGLVDNVTTILGRFFDIFPSDYEAPILALWEIGEAMNTFAEKAADFTVKLKVIDSENTSIGSMFTNVFADLQGVVEQLQKVDIRKLEQYSTALDGIADNMYVSFSGGLREHTVDVQQLAIELISSFVDAAKTKYIDMFSVGVKSAQRIVAGFKTVRISVIMSTALSDGLRKINEYYDDYKLAGVHLIDGFISGFSGLTSINAVRVAATRVGETAHNALKNALQERSPSRLTYQSGTYFIMGFTKALADRLVLVRNASASVGDTAYAGMSASIEQIADAVNNEIDTQPVIRPVLDLDNVRSSVGTLDALFSRSQAVRISNGIGYNADSQAPLTKATASINFTQNNYSPKALTRFEIYRQTKNQLSAMKGLVTSR